MRLGPPREIEAAREMEDSMLALAGARGGAGDEERDGAGDGARCGEWSWLVGRLGRLRRGGGACGGCACGENGYGGL